MASEIKVDKISPSTGTALQWGDSGDTFTIPSGATVTNNGTATGFVSAGALDLNGAKLTIDANGNTSITSDTDDQIDFEIAGADDFQMTANTFTALSGSKVAMAAGGSITNAGTMAPDISSTGKTLVFGF